MREHREPGARAFGPPLDVAVEPVRGEPGRRLGRNARVPDDVGILEQPLEAGDVALVERLEPDRLVGEWRVGRRQAPWHFLNFLPEPHGQSSFRPTFSYAPATRCCGRWSVFTAVASPPSAPAITAAPASVSCS